MAHARTRTRTSRVTPLRSDGAAHTQGVTHPPWLARVLTRGRCSPVARAGAEVCWPRGPSLQPRGGASPTGPPSVRGADAASGWSRCPETTSGGRRPGGPRGEGLCPRCRQRAVPVAWGAGDCGFPRSWGRRPRACSQGGGAACAPRSLRNRGPHLIPSSVPRDPTFCLVTQLARRGCAPNTGTRARPRLQVCEPIKSVSERGRGRGLEGGPRSPSASFPHGPPRHGVHAFPCALSRSRRRHTAGSPRGGER